MWRSLVFLAACGGSGSGSGGGDCELDGSVSGAAAWSSDSTPACLIPFAGDSGLWMVYRPLGEEVFSFEIIVDPIQAGEIGTFEAGVGVYLDPQTTFAATACSVTVEEDTLVEENPLPDGDEYLVVGTGSCTEPATGDSGALEIAPFAFRFPARWQIAP